MKKIVIAVLCGIVVCVGVIITCLGSGNRLVIAPTEEYIIQCLDKVPGVMEIEAVTENTDPMKNLNKPGWYTAHVYFSYSLINQEKVYGDNLIGKGTNAGGSIEVYKTKKEAKKRNEYLALFDGGALSSGSHIVVGTVVVRTSDELTASQQKFLENNIIFVLKGQEEKLEDLIKKTYNIGSFIKIDDDQIRVVVESDDTSATLANNIMRTLQNEFENKMYISVKFQ